jgi:hypothetical protein
MDIIEKPDLLKDNPSIGGIGGIDPGQENIRTKDADFIFMGTGMYGEFFDDISRGKRIDSPPAGHDRFIIECFIVRFQPARVHNAIGVGQYNDFSGAVRYSAVSGRKGILSALMNDTKGVFPHDIHRAVGRTIIDQNNFMAFLRIIDSRQGIKTPRDGRFRIVNGDDNAESKAHDS